MSTFLDAIIPVVDVLETLQIPYYLGGSAASIAHGVPRTTMDVDMVVDLHLHQVETFVQQVQSAYFVQSADVYDAIAHRSSFNLVHLTSMLKVDIFIQPDRPFDQEKAIRAQPGKITANDPRAFNLTSAEDIILQKLEWYRLGGEVSERQWNDVQGVLKVQSNALNQEYLRHWASELNIADLLERALRDAGL